MLQELWEREVASQPFRLEVVQGTQCLSLRLPQRQHTRIRERRQFTVLLTHYRIRAHQSPAQVPVRHLLLLPLLLHLQILIFLPLQPNVIHYQVPHRLFLPILLVVHNTPSHHLV